MCIIALLLPFLSVVELATTVPTSALTRFPIGPDECGKTRACWTPLGCDSSGSCNSLIRWRFAQNKLHIEMQAKSITSMDAQWMAMAFSDDLGMGNDTVFICIFGVDGGNRAELAYNQWTDNIPLTEASKVMIKDPEFSIKNDMVACAFTVDYSRKPTSLAEQKMILHLNGKDWWHVLFAQGPAARKTGQKDFHFLVQKSEQLVRVCEQCSDKLAVLPGTM